MPRRRLRWSSVLCVFFCAVLSVAAGDDPPNVLTENERAAGWRLLFDGRTTNGWRGFNQTAFPTNGWSVVDGCLHHAERGRGGDIVTTELFQNYELRFDWKIAAGANSGLKYFISDDRQGAIGHEYQLLGSRSREEALQSPIRGTASFYAVLPPSGPAVPRPPGEWNESRIIISGQSVEHWLNGERVLSYELGSEAVKAGIQASKFKDVPGFGTSFPHRILLQDHGGEVWFRNLKIRVTRSGSH